MKYKNWKEGKKVPKSYEVVDGWVMPDWIAPFFPGDDMLGPGSIFYITDGDYWDLEKNSFAD